MVRWFGGRKESRRLLYQVFKVEWDRFLQLIRSTGVASWDMNYGATMFRPTRISILTSTSKSINRANELLSSYASRHRHISV